VSMHSLISTITSKDGTTIASDRIGVGSPLILVVGAFNDRSTGGPLAEALADKLTVVNYNRRGRGASGDTAPYAVEREVEDLDALIEDVGGEASVFGYSSGAALAIDSAAAGSTVTKLALYDLPPVIDDDRPGDSVDHASKLADLVAEGRRGEAVE
jgi:thioesterase domain-containing protein